MRKSIPIILAVLCLFGFGCEAPKQSAKARPAKGGLDEPPLISLVQLIANPQDYHGKEVIVMGYLNLMLEGKIPFPFEGNAIYLHEDDWKHAVAKNGLALEITSDFAKKQSWVDGKYVILRGRFNANNKGKGGHWSGTIENVSNISYRR